jgi:hypothetical protein
VEVNIKTSGCRESIEQVFEVGHMLRNSRNDDKVVIRVLKDGAGGIMYKGVKKEPARGAVSTKIWCG